jgi:putative transposase
VLNEEMTEHLGCEKHEPAGAGTGNIRNGTRAKTVLTDTTGQVEIDVPRDRAATFEPQTVKKRQRRLSSVDEVVLSPYAHRRLGVRPAAQPPLASTVTPR